MMEKRGEGGSAAQLFGLESKLLNFQVGARLQYPVCTYKQYCTDVLLFKLVTFIVQV